MMVTEAESKRAKPTYPLIDVFAVELSMLRIDVELNVATPTTPKKEPPVIDKFPSRTPAPKDPKKPLNHEDIVPPVI